MARQHIDKPVLVLVGPTAVGKTELTFTLCRRFACEVVSMDSMQVYRGMNIGTAKPSRAEQDEIPHHLIDIVNPDEQYDAARFVRDCLQAVGSVHERGRVPLITGGTGMYLTALIEGLFDEVKVSGEIRGQLRQELDKQGSRRLHAQLAQVDPKSAARIHVNDRQRILRGLEIYLGTGLPWSIHLERQRRQGRGVDFARILLIGLHCDRAELYRRIDERTLEMIERGLEREVRELLNAGYSATLPSMQAIGYRHMCRYIDDACILDDMIAELQRDTRRYAKRQLTWFCKIPQLTWVPREDKEGVLKKTEMFFNTISVL